ncbi:MAG: ankyrin repeat domain-containing protein, partial [Candidatus Poribacteria bacterium]|nr:ankyrin repeat domain-containing protein [Candidatus Poribacteria bacterium]
MSTQDDQYNNPVTDLTTLCRAAGSGDFDTVRSILDASPSLLDAQDALGDTALGHAARRGHTEIVRLLFERGAKTNVVRSANSPGWSAFYWATGYGAKSEVVRLFLDHGADVNATATHHAATNDTPLHNAARYGHDEVIRLLIQAGGNLHARRGDGDARTDGYTPLHVAVRYSHDDAANALIKAGAT